MASDEKRSHSYLSVGECRIGLAARLEIDNKALLFSPIGQTASHFATAAKALTVARFTMSLRALAHMAATFVRMADDLSRAHCDLALNSSVSALNSAAHAPLKRQTAAVGQRKLSATGATCLNRKAWSDP